MIELWIAISVITGVVGCLIGYNLGTKRQPVGFDPSVLCRSLEKIVDNTIEQSRRMGDMVVLAQEQQLDRINAEYVAEVAYRNGAGPSATNGYIEEPEPDHDPYPTDIP